MAIQISGFQIKSNAIIADKINAGAVTNAKIGADAIDQSKIADNAVQKEHLNSDVVNSAGGIQLNGTTNDLELKLEGSSLGKSSSGLKIAANGVNSTEIASSAVTNDKLAANAVTAAKLNLTSGQTYDFSSVTAFRAPTPTASGNANDIVTLGYLTGVVNGIFWKESCRAATTGSNFASSYNNGSSGVGATLTASSNGAISVDGVALSSNDRVLIKDQTAGAQNGIYKVTTVGDGSNPAVLTRAEDMDETGEMNGIAVFVYQGTTNGDVAFVCTSDNVTVGTDAINFSQFTGGAAIANGSISTAKLADGAVTAVKIGTKAVTFDKVSFVTAQEKISGTNSLSYNLSNDITHADALEQVMVFVNGIMQEIVQSSPSDSSQYTVATASGTTTITFGGSAGDLNGETIYVVYQTDKP